MTFSQILSWYVVAVSCLSENDETTLLQLRTNMQTRSVPVPATMEANSLLASVMKFQALHASGQSPEAVDDIIDQLKSAIAQMKPLLDVEHAEAQAQVQAQVVEIEACQGSASHGTDVLDHLASELSAINECHGEVSVATSTKEHACNAWTVHASAVTVPCLDPDADPEQVYLVAQTMHDAWPTMNSLRTSCNEATVALADVTTRCTAVIAQYETKFCQHESACTLLGACHDHGVAVYNHFMDQSQISMEARQNQYRVLKQADCVLDLMRGSVPTNETMEDSSLGSCDDNVNVDHLTLSYPMPATPPDCPPVQDGDPQCPVIELPASWTSGEPTVNIPSALIVDGCVKSHEVHTRQIPAGPDITANVRCCEEDKPASTCVTGQLADGCARDKTFSEAEAICAANGLRICDEQEIMDRLCCGTGCDFDQRYVWVKAASMQVELGHCREADVHGGYCECPTGFALHSCQQKALESGFTVAEFSNFGNNYPHNTCWLMTNQAATPTSCPSDCTAVVGTGAVTTYGGDGTPLFQCLIM